MVEQQHARHAGQLPGRPGECLVAHEGGMRRLFKSLAGDRLLHGSIAHRPAVELVFARLAGIETIDVATDVAPFASLPRPLGR